ncbi:MULTISPECIES: hypothetical protein [Micromonosporaceae]|uniref:hypothetical protein n=1 Tax=Micromonosporaceae TaxID=28056 RepID=UPI00248C0D2D|nr:MULTISPECIES: hypothetical protein [unclassified Solwaraspora]WBC00513.1 hypothetical protein O7553_29355 [Solwaraspora sp. WMMA2059]WBC23874.1 hypothetical protein O7543_18005 [Solwaraspora sp. WMMA2080]WJK37908.1 hypothetical protein O7610_24520 [Solwaraspora sp. WMMA2065]
MSILRPGDEPMHYDDGSHRWIPPDPDYDQEIWENQVREHQHEHRGRPDPPPPRYRLIRRSAAR